MLSRYLVAVGRSTYKPMVVALAAMVMVVAAVEKVRGGPVGRS